jgi:hypothetical protein
MKNTDWSVTAVALPIESRMSCMFETIDFTDAYAIRLPKNAIADPELLSRFLFSHQPKWVALLMQVRDALVGRFGIKTSVQLLNSGGTHIGIFQIHAASTHEIVLGADDKHLDFRLSLLLRTKVIAMDRIPFLILSTVVHCHNRLGRAYIALIAPFHRWIVCSLLSSAARIGWPTS